MYLSTFKRNWILHYIKPEFLYLPRGKRDSYKEDHIEVEKKPGYMVIILRYSTDYRFLDGWKPTIEVTYFLRKTKHGTLEDTYFSTQASQGKKTTYKKITYDEEGIEHIEEVSAKSYTAVQSQSIAVGSISYPADGDWHDIIIYVPEPVEDYEFGYCELKSTLTNVIRAPKNVTPAKYNRVSDVILELPHGAAYIQFYNRHIVNKEYSIFNRINQVEHQVYSSGYDFTNLAFMGSNVTDSYYYTTIWKNSNQEGSTHQCRYFIEPDNNGNLSLSTRQMDTLVQDIADTFPTTTISVFLYDIFTTLSASIPLTMDIDWNCQSCTASIVNNNFPTLSSKVPLYNNFKETRTIDGQSQDLYELSNTSNGRPETVTITNAIVSKVERREEYFTYSAEEDPQFSESDEDRGTYIILQDADVNPTRLINLESLSQSDSLGYGGYYTESFAKAKVSFQINESNGSYQAPQKFWPTNANPSSNLYMWPPIYPFHQLSMTRSQFSDQSTQVGFTDIDFLNHSSDPDPDINRDGEIIKMISPINPSVKTFWGMPWYENTVEESDVDFTRKYTSGQVSIISGPSGDQGEYKLSDLKTKSIVTNYNETYATYVKSHYISWGDGKIHDDTDTEQQLIGYAYETELYFSEESKVIQYHYSLGSSYHYWNTLSIIPDVKVHRGNLRNVNYEHFREVHSHSQHELPINATKKEKANLKLINKTISHFIDYVLIENFPNPVPPGGTLLVFENAGGQLCFGGHKTDYSLTINVDDINDFTWNTDVSYYNLFNTNNPDCRTWIAHGNNNNNG